MKREGFIRGAFLLAVSQALFLITSYLIQIILGRVLGPTNYGNYGVALSILGIGLLAVSAGVPLSVSKLVAEETWSNKKVLFIAYRLEVMLGIICFSIYLVLSLVISNILNNSELGFLLEIGALVPLGYGLFSIATSFLNGKQEFTYQAMAQSSYYLLRPFLILGLVFFGFASAGAVLGNTTSPFIGFLITVVLYRMRNRESETERVSSSTNNEILRRVLAFAAPVAFFSISFNMLSNVDLWAVKALIASESAAGYYNAAYQFARFPLYAGQSLAAAVFPAVAFSKSNVGQDEVDKVTSVALKYISVLAASCFLSISLFSSDLIGILYGPVYESASEPLMILVCAISFQSVMGMIFYILNASGMTREPALISMMLVLLQVVILVFLVPSFDLHGAAYSTLSVSMLGTLLSIIVVHRTLSIKLPMRTLANIGLLAIFAYSASWLLSPFAARISVVALQMLKIGTLIIFIIGLFASKSASLNEIKSFL